MLYNCLRIAALAALTSGTLAANASAQASDLDGKAVIKNAYLAQKYVEYLKQPGFVHDEKSVRNLVGSLLSNHTLDEDEKDLIRELQRTDLKTIKVRLLNTDYDIPTANAQGRRIFKLVTKPVNFETYWDQTAEGLAALAELYSLSVAHKIPIQRFIAGKLLPAWKESNSNNQYTPYKKMLGSWNLLSQQGNSDASHASVRKMLHGSAEYLDAYKADYIPDYLYDWLQFDAQ